MPKYTEEDLEQQMKQEPEKVLPPPEVIMRLTQMQKEGRIPPPEAFLQVMEELGYQQKKRGLTAKIAKELSQPPAMRNGRKIRKLQEELRDCIAKSKKLENKGAQPGY